MANVPDTSLGLSLRDQDERTGEVLTVPSARKFRISSTLPAPVTEFNRSVVLFSLSYLSGNSLKSSFRLWAWIDHFPLRTVQRILHILYPQSKDWGFVSETQPHYDDHIFKEFYFTRTECPSTPETASNSVLVACQPPWVLSSEDMWQFSELQSVSRDQHITGTKTDYPSCPLATRACEGKSVFGARFIINLVY